jgi:hypothetical protein
LLQLLEEKNLMEKHVSDMTQQLSIACDKQQQLTKHMLKYKTAALELEDLLVKEQQVQSSNSLMTL